MTDAPGLLGLQQPPVTSARLAEAKGALLRYRIMAFVTGVVLIAGCITLIFKYGTSVHIDTASGYLWIAHGWLFVVYVITTALLGVRLRWPLGRYALVMLAGTVPTMSFVAEHFVTKAATDAARGADAQPSDASA